MIFFSWNKTKNVAEFLNPSQIQGNRSIPKWYSVAGGVLLLYVCDLSFNVPSKKGFLIASAFYLESCMGVLSQNVSHTWKFLE